MSNTLTFSDEWEVVLYADRAFGKNDQATYHTLALALTLVLTQTQNPTPTNFSPPPPHPNPNP